MCFVQFPKDNEKENIMMMSEVILFTSLVLSFQVCSFRITVVMQAQGRALMIRGQAKEQSRLREENN